VISLAYPKDTENNYLFFLGGAFGPYGPNLTFAGENVTFNPKAQIFGQTRGIHHENNVTHDTIQGLFEYNPLFSHQSLAATPNAQYPNKISVALANGYGTIAVRTANLGIISEGCTSLNYSAVTNPTGVTHYEYFQASGYWNWYQVTVNLKTPGKVYDYWLYEITSYKDLGGGNIQVFYKKTQFINSDPLTSGWETGTDWTKPQSWGAIQMISALGSKVASATSTSSLGYRYTDKTPLTFNPAIGIEFVSLLIDQYVPGMFPLEDVHYGDLAMKASEKVIANDVNMIAFFRDLKHPETMIPKLKNLKSLKSYANDYLSVKYGILPTISDLQRIRDAFKKVRPYLDKNGFKSYSAGHIEHLTSGNEYYELEQHIKLGIDNEDNALQALEQGLENIGMLPTMENLWDLIPYSFVVDWFVQVGDLLERADACQRLMRLNIRYATMSRKSTAQKRILPRIGSPYFGTAVWVHYHRWVSDQCPVPPLSLKANISDFNHWLEGGALLLQRKRR